MNKKQTNEQMKHEKWTREEDIDLIKTINKHLTPRIKWNEIESNQFPSGRNLISMKERWRRLSEFCSFENEQFRINVPKYIRHKEEAEKKREKGRSAGVFKKISESSVQNVNPKFEKSLSSLNYDFMTVAECAKFLRVTPTTIRNMVKRKDVKAVRFGLNNKSIRIPRNEVEKLLS